MKASFTKAKRMEQEQCTFTMGMHSKEIFNLELNMETGNLHSAMETIFLVNMNMVFVVVLENINTPMEITTMVIT